MNERDRELEAFSKFIGALEPWLGEVVLIGGWAHRLYRHHPLARRLAYLPLITLDGDVAVPPKLKGRKLSVRKRLWARIGHRQRTTTMEKGAGSTRNSYHRS